MKVLENIVILELGTERNRRWKTIFQYFNLQMSLAESRRRVSLYYRFVHKKVKRGYAENIWKMSVIVGTIDEKGTGP